MVHGSGHSYSTGYHPKRNENREQRIYETWVTTSSVKTTQVIHPRRGVLSKGEHSVSGKTILRYSPSGWSVRFTGPDL
jgi:hypothetical protein